MIYAFSGFQVDSDRLELSRDGETIALQPQAFALLLFLIENADRVVSKDEVIDTVWQGRIVGDGTLNARINAIRRALGDDGTTQGMIKTLPRQGFRFVAALEDPANASAPAAPAAGLAAAPSKASIAVLPFVNIGADQEQVYFADGLTEDLITDLSKNRDLFVIAHNSSFSFRNSPKNVTEIGQELGVAHVLEGSVRKAGNRIRINAQLIDTQTGGHVWAERYDSDVQDIFELQDEITVKITKALEVSLTPSGAARRGTDSVEAYELSLKGRAKFFMFSPEENQNCIDLLDQAISMDPEYSDAWAELVFPYQSGWSFAWPGYDNGLKIAAEKARRAVELDSNSSLALSRLGWVEIFLGEAKQSIAHFDRAVEIDPNNADTHIWFSEALNFAGHPARAVEMGLTARHFDPLGPPNVLHHIGHAYFLLGDLDRGEEYIGRAIRMAPTFPPARLVMAALLAEAGRIGDAEAQISDLLAIDPAYDFKRYDERYPYYDEGHRNRMAAGLKLAGLR